jgi:hypothetical protein
MPRHLTALPRVLATAILIAATAIPALATASLAATDGVACGMVSAYTAPDPATPTDGTITIGLDQVEAIAATATLSANLAANLPAILNSSPTCLAITADSGGIITALDFAPSGTVCGTLELDPSSNFYVVARAFIIPVTLVDSEVAFSALFGVSFASGGEACVTFTVDTTTGAISAFSGTTSVCGAAVAHTDGSLDIGSATVPTGVVSTNGLAAVSIAESAGDDVCADIRSAGTVDTSGGGIVASAEATIGFDHCGTLGSGAAGVITVDGSAITAFTSLALGVRSGMHVEVAATAPGTIVGATVAGCVAPAATPETLPNSSTAGSASLVGGPDLIVLLSVLAALSGAGWAMRRIRPVR